MPLRRRSRSSRSLLWLWLGEELDDLFCTRELRLDFYWKNLLLFIYPVGKNAHKDFMLNFPEHEAEVQGVLKNGWSPSSARQDFAALKLWIDNTVQFVSFNESHIYEVLGTVYMLDDAVQLCLDVDLADSCSLYLRPCSTASTLSPSHARQDWLALLDSHVFCYCFNMFQHFATI